MMSTKPRIFSQLKRQAADAAIAATLVLALTAPVQAASPKSRVTVADLVELVHFGDPNTIEWDEVEQYDLDRNVGLTSPDGKFMATLARGGNARDGMLVTKLYIFETARLREKQHHEPLLTVKAEAGYQPLAKLKWASDSQSLFALTAPRKDKPRLVRIMIDTGEQRVVSSGDRAIEDYAISDDGSVAVVWDKRDESLTLAHNCLEIACLTPIAEPWEHVLSRPVLDTAAYDLKTNNAVRMTPARDFLGMGPCSPWGDKPISPDGRYLLETCRLMQWPDFDKDDPILASASMKYCVLERSPGCFAQIVISDLREGRRWHLGKKAIRIGTPVWVGNNSVVLVGVPADLFSPSSRGNAERRTSVCGAAGLVARRDCSRTWTGFQRRGVYYKGVADR